MICKLSDRNLQSQRNNLYIHTAIVQPNLHHGNPTEPQQSCQTSSALKNFEADSAVAYMSRVQSASIMCGIVTRVFCMMPDFQLMLLPNITSANMDKRKAPRKHTHHAWLTPTITAAGEQGCMYCVSGCKQSPTYKQIC